VVEGWRHAFQGDNPKSCGGDPNAGWDDSQLIKIGSPVGDLARTKKPGNRPRDVEVVKKALVVLGINPRLELGGAATPQLTRAIRKLQRLFKMSQDGRIDPNGGTLRKLNELAGGKAIVVNLDRQILSAFRRLQRVYRWDCASGDSKHRTPPGYFKIHRKHRIYRSKTYDTQMDYAMFFHRGYAIHMAYGVRIISTLRWAGFSQFGSHGCVRLAEADASKLFHWTPMGTPVLILPRA